MVWGLLLLKVTVLVPAVNAPLLVKLPTKLWRKLPALKVPDALMVKFQSITISLPADTVAAVLAMIRLFRLELVLLSVIACAALPFMLTVPLL